MPNVQKQPHREKSHLGRGKTQSKRHRVGPKLLSVECKPGSAGWMAAEQMLAIGVRAVVVCETRGPWGTPTQYERGQHLPSCPELFLFSPCNKRASGLLQGLPPTFLSLSLRLGYSHLQKRLFCSFTYCFQPVEVSSLKSHLFQSSCQIQRIPKAQSTYSLFLSKYSLSTYLVPGIITLALGTEV